MAGHGSIYRGPTPLNYLFIDGPFFEGVIKDFIKPFGLENTPSINYQSISNQYDRIIYYDALPVKKGNQTVEEHKIQFDNKRDFLNDIRSQKNFHVRDGYTRNRPSSSSRLEQKGVDTWIAVDALMYALRGIVDTVTIITSDLDLYPLFEALTQTKVKGVLRFDPQRTADELIYAADEARPITQWELFRWLSPDFAAEYTPSSSNTKIRNTANSRMLYSTDTERGKFEVKYLEDLEEYECSFSGSGKIFGKKLFVLVRYMREQYKLELPYDEKYEY